MKWEENHSQSSLNNAFKKFNGELKKSSEIASGTAHKKGEEEIKSHFTEAESQSAAYCPKCHSTSILASERGYSGGSGIAGALFFGLFGLIFGPIGVIIGVILGILSGFSGSKRIKITCLKCGHKYRPKKR